MLAGVATIAIIVCSSFFVTVHTPLHIVSVNHFHWSIAYSGKTMTDGAIHTALDMNPVGKDDKAWKFIHPLPWDLFPCLYIFDDFKCLRSFTDRIARMAGSTELNVWNPRGTIPFDIAVAERTVQMGCFFVMDMIEKDGLIDRFPREYWKDREENSFGLDLKSIIGNNGKKKK